MDEFIFSTVWATAQAVVVCVVAGVASCFLMSRRPEVAARMVSATAVVLLVVGLFVFIPTPVWSPSVVSDETSEVEITHSVPTTVEPTSVDAWANSFAEVRLRLPKFVQSTVGTVREASPAVEQRSGVWWLVLLLTGLCFGVTRVTCGLWSLRSLRRSAQPISQEEPVYQLVSELSELIGDCPQKLVIAESEEVDCAAVVGFFRPMILLSPDWRDWERAEVRTVLAHELSHVARRDALWRFVAVAATAMHFLNPFTHWLTRRLVLAQELAADRRALRSMGQGVYVRSLSRLALRHDSTVSGSRVRAHSLFTPVFAGHLMRRIEMLVAKDCGGTRQGRRWVSPLVIVLIAGLAIASTAARGIAGPQEKTKKPTTQESAIRTVSATTDKKTKFSLFSRHSAPANDAIFSEHGAVHIVVPPLMKFPSFKASIAAALAEASSLQDLDLTKLASASANAYVQLDYNRKLPAGSKSADPNRMSLGFSQFAVATSVDVEWDSVVQKSLPSAEAEDRDGVNGWSAQFRGHPISLVARTARELRLYPSMDLADRTFRNPGLVLATKARTPKMPDWQADWEAVSGGVASVLFKTLERGKPAEGDEPARLLRDFYSKTDVTAY
ncbi:MAG: M56 family metallopeptidase, partial [Planctomycetaceae bacterium]